MYENGFLNMGPDKTARILSGFGAGLWITDVVIDGSSQYVYETVPGQFVFALQNWRATLGRPFPYGEDVIPDR